MQIKSTEAKRLLKTHYVKRTSLSVQFPSRLSMLWAFFSSFFSSFSGERNSWETDLTGWTEALFLFDEAPLKAETHKERVLEFKVTVCGWCWILLSKWLTMKLFEYSWTHEFQKPVCIETGPVNWHCVLKSKQSHYSRHTCTLHSCKCSM